MSSVNSSSIFSLAYGKAGFADAPDNAGNSGVTSGENGANTEKSPADTVTISAEGELAAARIAAKSYWKYQQKADVESWMDSLVQSGKSCPPFKGEAEIAANTKHRDIAAWVLGMPERDEFTTWHFGRGELRNQAILESAKLDAMVSKLISSRGITLENDETLNFTLNQNGEIKLDLEGIKDSEKREAIEKALNGDDEIAFQIQKTHILKVYPEHFNELPFSQMMYELALNREFGISMDDFYYEKYTDEAGHEWSHFAYKGDNPDEFRRMYEEEQTLFERVSRSEWIGSQNKLEYELRFSYRNGILLERGVDDMEGITKRLTAEFDPNYNMANKDFNLTVDRDGQLVEFTLEKLKGLDREEHGRLYDFHESLFIHNVANQNSTAPGKYYNPFADGKMAELTSKSQRLMQFEFGIAPEEFDEFKVEIIGRIDSETELSITAVKKGMVEIPGTGNDSGEDAELTEKLNLYSISSNHPAFMVDVTNVLEKEPAESKADQNATEISLQRQISVQFSPTLEKTEAARYLSGPSDFMKEMINKALNMFQNNMTDLNYSAFRRQ